MSPARAARTLAGVAVPPPSGGTSPIRRSAVGSVRPVATKHPGPLGEQESQELMEAIKAELAAREDPSERARLLQQLGWACENGPGDSAQALTYYKQALELLPDHLPTLRSARSMHLRMKQLQPAVALLDVEIRVTPEPRDKASLTFQKGWWLEEAGNPEAAKQAYRSCCELDPAHMGALKALERLEHRSAQWAELVCTYGRCAEHVEESSVRAAFVTAQGQLAEARLKESDRAVGFYGEALQLDPDTPGALESLERIHRRAKRHAQVVAALEQQAERTTDVPTKALALIEAARIQVEHLDNNLGAIGCLERALNAAPDHRLALERLAALYERVGDGQKLVEALHKLAGVCEDELLRITSLHRAGEVLEGLHRMEDAAHAYTKALALAPAYAPSVRALERIYVASNQWEPLIGAWSSHAETVSDAVLRAQLHVRIADAFEAKLRNPEQAISQFDRAIQFDPGNEVALRALLRLYGARGQHRDLIALCERMIDAAKSTPRKIAYLFRIGDAQDRGLDQPEQAMRAYERILRLDPHHVGAMHALQDAAWRAGKHKAIVDALDLELNECSETSEKVAILNQMGMVLMEHLGDPSGAERRLTTALEADPDNPQTLRSLARVYWGVGRWEDWIRIQERLLPRTSDGLAKAETLFHIGTIYEKKLRRSSEAVEAYRQALQSAPGHGPALDALHHMLRRSGQWKELATVLSNRAAKTQDAHGKAVAHYEAGQVYESHVQDFAEAERAYTASLTADPTYRPAIEALSRLLDDAERWEPLARHLEKDAATAADPHRIASALMRRGEILWHHLGDGVGAIAPYEALRAHGQGRQLALLTLERLYDEQNNLAPKIEVVREQYGSLGDGALGIGLRLECARIEMGHPDLGDAKETLCQTLEVSTANEETLALLQHLALTKNDDDLLARVDVQLGSHSPTSDIEAVHLARYAAHLKRHDLSTALTTYSTALEKSPGYLPALYGLRNTATELGEQGALLTSLDAEASLTRQPAHAADLLTKAADLHLAGPNGDHAAIDSLRRALRECPDHEPAARRLHQLLVHREQIVEVIDALSTAASAATSPDRIRALWTMVADLRVHKQGDLPGGISALERALSVRKDDVSTLLRLGELLATNGQWQAAIERLEPVARDTRDPRVQLSAHRQLAGAYHRLDKYDRAELHIDAALKIEPEDPKTLTLLAELQRGRGQLDEAFATASRLTTLTAGADRAGALLCLAKIERARGRNHEAFDALQSAVAIEGPAGQAAKEVRSHLADARVAQAYAQALERFVGTATSREAVVAGYRELAEVRATALGMPETALSALRDGLHATGGDVSLSEELVRTLERAGRSHEAIVELQAAVSQQVTSAELWKHLARVLKQVGRTEQASAVVGPLEVLGGSSSGFSPPGVTSLSPEVLPNIGDDGLFDHAATRLLRVAVEAVPKLYGLDPQELGLTGLEHVGSRSMEPIRVLARQLGDLFCIKSFDLYAHDGPTPIVATLAADPPAILVSRQVDQLPEGQQIFLLGNALAAIAGRFYPVQCIPDAELVKFLSAAGHTVAPTFGIDLYDVDEIQDLAQRLRKALSWLSRRTVEEAASAFVQTSLSDPDQWCWSLRKAAARAAALASGHLPSAIAALQRLEQRTDEPIESYLKQSVLAQDLMAFWASDRAMNARDASSA